MATRSVFLVAPLDLASQILDRFIELPQDRLIKAARFHRLEDRHRCLLSGILLRTALMRAGVCPDLDRLLRPGALGKPQFPQGLALHCNLSHSGGWVACVVHSHPVGVDVETIDLVEPGMMKRIGTPSEQAWLMRQPKPEKTRAFFRLWTLKESLLKALGTGLSLDPRMVELEETGKSGWKASRTVGLDDLRSWQFREEHVDEGHALSICWSGAAPPPMEIIGCGSV